MNHFSMMMAASRTTNKKQEVVVQPVAPKRKVGSPPAAKVAPPEILPFPTVDLTTSTVPAASRQNYDLGDSKSNMDRALEIMLKSRGCHARRTAQIYSVSRKSLVKRYNTTVKTEVDVPIGNDN
jgi:hypothetical protein